MHRSKPHFHSITSLAQASMGATLLRYQCPPPVRLNRHRNGLSAICSIYRCIPGGARYVRFTEAFLVTPHQDLFPRALANRP
jgi:hypothetical protein